MFNWKTEAPQVYNIYLSVLTDPNTPVGLTRQQLLDRAETIVEETPKLFFPYIKSKNRKTRKPDLNWASKNKEWSKAYRNDYKRRTIVDDEDYLFSLSDLDNPAISDLIPTDSIARVIDCMKDSEALGIQFTRRLAKWVARLDKTQPPLNSVLPNTGIGLKYSLGWEDVEESKKVIPKEFKIDERVEIVNPVFGVLDIAVIYSRAERNHAMSNSAIPFNSSTLDKAFLFDSPRETTPKFYTDYYMVNPKLERFFKFLADKNTSQVDSRKYVKKFIEFPSYAYENDKDKPSGLVGYYYDFEMFINDDDLPTIFDRYINDPTRRTVKITREQADLIDRGKLTPQETIDPNSDPNL